MLVLVLYNVEHNKKHAESCVSEKFSELKFHSFILCLFSWLVRFRVILKLFLLSKTKKKAKKAEPKFKDLCRNT